MTKSEYAYRLDSRIKRLRVDETSYKTDNKIKKITRRLSIARLSKLKKIIITDDPDIIISFLPEPSLRLMFLSKISKKIRRIPKIISIRNDPEKEFSNSLIRRVMKKLYKSVDGMVYQTDDAKNYFEGIIKTKYQAIIQNPIDPTMLVEPKKDEERKKVIISVGRLEEQKNQEMLIRAFADTFKVKKHDYLLKIYGEGSLHNYLQKLIDELGIADKAVLVGQVDDVQKELNEAKIFVLSSRYEGMPNALIEALAVGLPCISTDCPCGGPRSLIRDGENGILINNENKNELVGAMCKLIDDRGMRNRISKEALKIRKSNSLGQIKDKWYLLINSILRGKN